MYSSYGSSPPPGFLPSLYSIFFLTWTQSGTPIEISLCYFYNFNHPQKDWPISFRMKYVITVMNISIGLTQRGLIWGLRRDDFIMKLIDLLIRELDNCSLGGSFWVSRRAEICQCDRFSSAINFKRARNCNYEIPRLVQVKMKILKYWLKVWQEWSFIWSKKSSPGLKAGPHDQVL